MKTHICSLLRECEDKNENIMIMNNNCIDFLHMEANAAPQEIIKWLNNHANESAECPEQIFQFAVSLSVVLKLSRHGSRDLPRNRFIVDIV